MPPFRLCRAASSGLAVRAPTQGKWSMETDQQQPRARLAINGRGELIDQAGRIRGRLVEIEIELDDDALSLLDPVGVFSSKSDGETAKAEERKKASPSKEIAPEVAEVWALYLQLKGGRERALGDKQQRDIERALKVRDLDTVKRAVAGLFRSPWHTGQNDGGRKYLDIRYALRGNGGRGESNEERIDRMAEGVKEVPSSSAGGAPQLRRRGGYIDVLIRKVEGNSRRPPSYPPEWDEAEAEEQRIARRDEAAAQLLSEYRIATTYAPDGRPIFADLVEEPAA